MVLGQTLTVPGELYPRKYCLVHLEFSRERGGGEAQSQAGVQAGMGQGKAPLGHRKGPLGGSEGSRAPGGHEVGKWAGGPG